MFLEIMERNISETQEIWNGNCPFSDCNNTDTYDLRLEVWIPLACLVFLLAFWHHWESCAGDPDNSLPLPPGSMGWPLIGDTLSFVLQGVAFFRNRLETYGPVFKTHLLGRPTVRLVGADRIRAVQVREHELVDAYWPTSARMLLGQGSLSMMTGTEHRIHRKNFLKAFSHQELVSYVPLIHGIVRRHLSSWSQSGSALAYPSIKALMFDISLQVLLKCHVDESASKELLDTFETLLNNLFSLPVNFPGFGLWKGMQARNKIINTLKERMEDRKETLSMFQLSHSDAMSDEAFDPILEVLFTGHGTTASALCSSLIHLLQNPKIAEALKVEVSESLSDAEVDYNLLGKSQLLNDFVKEVLRISPPAGGVFRKVKKTFELDGFQIPSGWTLVYGIRDTHHTNAHKFDPNRWSTSQKEKSEPQFLTFGHGSRTCPGREFAKLVMKVFIVEVLLKYDISLVSEDVHMKYVPVPHPSDGLPIEVVAL